MAKAGVGLLDTSPYWRTAVTLCRLASNSERIVADGCVISDELWLSKRTPAWKDKLEPRRCNRTDDHRSVTPRFPYRA